MSTTLREVLAEHVPVTEICECWEGPHVALTGCGCGKWADDQESWTAHVESAILAHLADVLGSEEVREAVRSAVANTVCRCDDPLGGIICADCDADAALTAVRAALGIDAASREGGAMSERLPEKAQEQVAAVETLAARWADVLDECKQADPRWILDRSVTTLSTALDELRAALALRVPPATSRRPWCLCTPGIGPHDDGCPAASEIPSPPGQTPPTQTPEATR